MIPELYDEDVDVDVEAVELEDELAVRRTMIRVFQLEAEAKKVRATRDAIASTYNEQIGRLDSEAELLRAAIAGFVDRAGENVRFPDVGTAYFTSTPAKIVVVDREAFEAELGAMFVKESFDETSAKAYALSYALSDGVIAPGTELEPEGKRLALRKA